MKFYLENYIRIISGIFVFASALFGFLYSKYWLIFTMFVGLNLTQFGFTDFCPVAFMLKKAGIKEKHK